MQVRLYATLRQMARTRLIEVPVEGKQTVGDVLRALVARYPELSDAVWHTDGSLSGHIAVILNGRDVRHLAGVETSLSDDDQLDVFPPVAGGGDGDDLTHVTLRFTSHFRARAGQSQTEFAFRGNTLRGFVPAVLEQYDIGDLLLDGSNELKPYVRVAINGRFSHTIGNWEAPIPDGATVVLIHSYVVAF